MTCTTNAPEQRALWVVSDIKWKDKDTVAKFMAIFQATDHPPHPQHPCLHILLLWTLIAFWRTSHCRKLQEAINCTPGRESRPLTNYSMWKLS